MGKILNYSLLAACLMFSQEGIAQDQEIIVQDQEGIAQDQEVIEQDQEVIRQKKNTVDYKSLLASNKISPDVYGLAAVLIMADPTSYEESDEIIKYFIARGCNINQPIVYSVFRKSMCSIYKLLKDPEADEKDLAIEIAEIEPFLLKCASSIGLKWHLFTIACGSQNIGLMKALLDNGISANNWGGTALFMQCIVEYDAINSGYCCAECCPESYSQAIVDILKNVHGQSSFCTRSCLSLYAYLMTSKDAYNRIFKK